MKSSSLFIAGVSLLALATIVAPIAIADGVPAGDPEFGFQGAQVTDPPIAITTPDFSLDYDSTTGDCTVVPPGEPYGTSPPPCYLENNIVLGGVGQTIYGITITFDASDVTCADLGSLALFSSCTSDGSPDTSTSTLTFADGDVAYGTAFYAVFGSGFPTADGTATANILPEPGTLSLLGLGLVALVGFARKRVLSSAAKSVVTSFC